MAGASADSEGQSVWWWTVSLWAVWSRDQALPFSRPDRKGEVAIMVSYQPTDDYLNVNLHTYLIQM